MTKWVLLAACFMCCAAASRAQQDGASVAAAATSGPSVPTFHGDNFRTGWNSSETQLNPAVLKSGTFGLTATVQLDDQVDAQPLVRSRQAIGDKGIRSVVYVATESNTIYAIDAVSGEILLKRTLGAPVPAEKTPGEGDCDNNGPNIGINSTPVIDEKTETLYVMSYQWVENKQEYLLYAVSLSDLTDKIPPRLVDATQKLSDGSDFPFDASVQRQRPGLVLANGAIYAAFGSFCDFRADASRGWVLGWSAATLAPLPVATLINRVSRDPLAANASTSIFLSSIWMSGYGIAADGDPQAEGARLYFTTGNSHSDPDKGETSFDPKLNLEESVVQVAPDLTVTDFFAPHELMDLDAHDLDLAAGGVMVLPTKPDAGAPKLAAVVAKTGKLYLLNRDKLGGFAANDDVVATVDAGACWCGLSYFMGSDGMQRIVSSGGANGDGTPQMKPYDRGHARILVWKVQSSDASALALEKQFDVISSGQFSGVFTSVSSNGADSKSTLIWTVARPFDKTAPTVRLFAFGLDEGGAPLFSAEAGPWPSMNADANIVPVVAGGHVYVASYRQLRIFGVVGGSKAIASATEAPVPVAMEMMDTLGPSATASPSTAVAASDKATATTVLYGQVGKIGNKGNQITLKTDSGPPVTVDAKMANKKYLSFGPTKGDYVKIVGKRDKNGVLQARTISRAKR